jgi:hypothetical protein
VLAHLVHASQPRHGYLHLLRYTRIPNVFIHEALARSDHGTFVSQPRQSDWHLFLITRAYAISDDIDFVSGPEEVECGLSDADVALDADNNAGERTGGVERV